MNEMLCEFEKYFPCLCMKKITTHLFIGTDVTYVMIHSLEKKMFIFSHILKNIYTQKSIYEHKHKHFVIKNEK